MIWDRTGWLQVDGFRFLAFLPLGSKIILEQEMLFLAEAYNWSPDQVKAMPSSQRHRFVKMKEDIERTKNNGGGETISAASGAPTGISPAPSQGAGSRPVSVGYSPESPRGPALQGGER